MTDTRRDLPVPDQSVAALPDPYVWMEYGAYNDPSRRREVAADRVLAIASPVVAAVLREEAEALTRRTTEWWALCREYDQTPDEDERERMTGLGEAASRLRARADELERKND